MKKVIKQWFVLAICALSTISFAACSDDDDTTDKKPTTDPEMSSDWRTEAVYKGDYYDNGTGNIWVNFLSKNLKWDNDKEDYVGTGDLVCLDFNTILAENPDFATLADGTYTMDGTHDEYTLNDSGDSYILMYADGTYTAYWVTAGSATVETKGNTFIIKAQLELNYYLDYEFEYVGPIRPINRSLEGEMSNLTGNVTANDFTQGVAMYLGETFTESSDYCIVVLAGDDYDLEENFGNSPSLALGLNLTPGSNTGIPSGTYSIISAYDSDDYDAFTCLSGVYQPTYGGYFGAWYFSTLQGIEASMQTGTITVNNKGNNNYDITYNMEDGYGNKVTGKYSGAISFRDYSDDEEEE